MTQRFGCGGHGGKGGNGADGGRGRDGSAGVSMDLFTVGNQAIEVLEDVNPPAINYTYFGICGEISTTTTDTTSESNTVSNTETGAVSETNQNSSTGSSLLIAIILIVVAVLLVIAIIVCIVLLFFISRNRKKTEHLSVELTAPQLYSTLSVRINTDKRRKWVYLSDSCREFERC